MDWMIASIIIGIAVAVILLGLLILAVIFLKSIRDELRDFNNFNYCSEWEAVRGSGGEYEWVVSRFIKDRITAGKLEDVRWGKQ